MILGASSIAGRLTSEGRVTANIYLQLSETKRTHFQELREEVAIIRIFEKLALATEFSRSKFHLLGVLFLFFTLFDALLASHLFLLTSVLQVNVNELQTFMLFDLFFFP